MTADLILKSTEYVTSAPLFWGSMGFTTALGMFIGALIYDGQLRQAQKGMLSLLSYSGMIFWVNAVRVHETTSRAEFLLQTSHPEYAYASLVTIFWVTLCWAFGVLLGVTIFSFKYRGGHD